MMPPHPIISQLRAEIDAVLGWWIGGSLWRLYFVASIPTLFVFVIIGGIKALFTKAPKPKNKRKVNGI